MLTIDHTPDSNLCSELVIRMKNRIPGLKIGFKDESFLRFFRGRLWRGSVTATRKKIWLPSRDVYTKHPMAFRMLAYGYVISLDRNERPFVWWLLFWFPYYFLFLSLLSVLSVFSPLFLLSLISMLSAFPFRSKLRALLLSRGYAAVLAINIWRHGSILPGTRDWIIEKMTGADGHWWMTVDRETATQIIMEYESLASRVDAIRGDNILSHSDAYSDIYEIVTGIEREDMDE